MTTVTTIAAAMAGTDEARVYRRTEAKPKSEEARAIDRRSKIEDRGSKVEEKFYSKRDAMRLDAQ